MHFQSELDEHSNDLLVSSFVLEITPISLSDVTLRSLSLLINFDADGNFIYVSCTDSCATRSLDNVVSHYIDGYLTKLDNAISRRGRAPRWRSLKD